MDVPCACHYYTGSIKDLLSITMINVYSYNCKCSNIILVRLSRAILQRTVRYVSINVTFNSLSSSVGVQINDSFHSAVFVCWLDEVNWLIFTHLSYFLHFVSGLLHHSLSSTRAWVNLWWIIQWFSPSLISTSLPLASTWNLLTKTSVLLNSMTPSSKVRTLHRLPVLCGKLFEPTGHHQRIDSFNSLCTLTHKCYLKQ